MDATIAPPNGAGDSVINVFVAWTDPNTNGSASGNFKYDFVADNISDAGFMAGNGVVSNGIPVEGTAVAPVVPNSRRQRHPGRSGHRHSWLSGARG